MEAKVGQHVVVDVEHAGAGAVELLRILPVGDDVAQIDEVEPRIELGRRPGERHRDDALHRLLEQRGPVAQITARVILDLDAALARQVGDVPFRDGVEHVIDVHRMREDEALRRLGLLRLGLIGHSAERDGCRGCAGQ